MPISPYIAGLRERVGRDLLLLPAAAALIRNAAGEVLLQRRSDDGRWSLLGGAVDPGEPPARAVAREVFEESGLRVRPERLACVIGGREAAYPNGDRVEMTVVVFDCAVLGGRLEARDGESLELRWFDPDALPPSEWLERYPRSLFARAPEERALFAWDDGWLDGLG